MKRRKFLQAAAVTLTAPTLLLAMTKNNGVNDVTARPNNKLNLNMDIPELQPGDIGMDEPLVVKQDYSKRCSMIHGMQL